MSLRYVGKPDPRGCVIAFILIWGSAALLGYALAKLL